MELTTEICILGGGAAGIAAATVAARQGRDVVLVEKNEFLGGMATAAYVGTICGAYFRSNSDEPSFVADGFMREFTEKLAIASETNPMRAKEGIWYLPYQREAFLKLVHDEVSKAGAHVLFAGEFEQIIAATDNKILAVNIRKGSELISIHATHFIDCTGFALLADRPEAQLKSSNYQAGAFVFGLRNLKASNPLAINLALIKFLSSAIGKELSADGSWLSLMPGSLNENTAYFKLALAKPMDTKQLRQSAFDYAHQKLKEYMNALVAFSSIFSTCEINWLAPNIGVRTGPRYIGRYLLADQDVLHLRKSENSIARGAWPIEYWGFGKSVEMTYFDEMAYYDIPLEATHSPFYSNLYFAGRHISAEEQALASARVIGTCMQMGEGIVNYLK